MVFELDQESTQEDDRRTEGDQPILMQMVRAMIEQNRAQHQSQQRMQRKMIDQTEKFPRRT